MLRIVEVASHPRAWLGPRGYATETRLSLNSAAIMTTEFGLARFPRTPRSLAMSQIRGALLWHSSSLSECVRFRIMFVGPASLIPACLSQPE